MLSGAACLVPVIDDDLPRGPGPREIPGLWIAGEFLDGHPAPGVQVRVGFCAEHESCSETQLETGPDGLVSIDPPSSARVVRYHATRPGYEDVSGSMPLSSGPRRIELLLRPIPVALQLGPATSPEPPLRIDSFVYDAETRRGAVTVRGAGLGDRALVQGFIEDVCSAKNRLLVVGEGSREGARYETTNETAEGDRFTISFTCTY